ncbi:NUDIX hydrolase [Sulfitobacter sp. SK011]|uniref:NUDIX hydrolase n=1 Tax=Sulfitobacter sp. SK011 TaxID=1389004 RepID=UPI000E0C967A|nr:NUDIX hydrolase [Sulfitobacter sp. SK011]AXI41320.1 NUDIX hydrolase [Sulfitobacter sp. SK011]
MMHVFKRAWADMFMPILRRPKRVQVAALCYRDTDEGKRVLLITSRDTGRWIVPKGWPIDGLDGPGAALQEAWEEAGVKQADIESVPVGLYAYDKRLGEGLTVPVEARVYLTRVRNLSEEYPDSNLRKRAWFAPQEAANLVDEPDLKAILRAL